MSPRAPLPPEIDALLERERVILPLPAGQRSRALARAQASLATPSTATIAPSRAAPRTRWSIAAAVALVAGMALAAAAYELHARRASPLATRPAAGAPAADVVGKTPAAPPPATAAEELVPTRVSAAASATASPSDAVRAELRLMRQARLAVARGDFAGALSPIAEDTRRFKNGRLVEEREALRVKALAGLHRTQEARRAAVAFRARFPRSVLLPAVTRMPASGP